MAKRPRETSLARTPCESCGALFWETYPGARAETGPFGEDLCDRCEGVRLCEAGEHDFIGGRCVRCGAPIPQFEHVGRDRLGRPIVVRTN